jgi:hypothetical protein
MLAVRCVFSHANDDDHGGHLGNMVRALARWQRLVASCEATVALHWGMFIALYRPGCMVIKFAVQVGTFVYIIDNSAARKKIFLPI